MTDAIRLPAPHAPPVHLTVKDIETVRALNRYFLLSAEQVRRLFYGDGSIKWAKARLKYLSDHGYAHALKIARTDNRGNRAFVYRLGPEGLKLCRRMGEPVPRRLRLYQASESEYYVPHTLAINDVLIAADLLARTRPDVSVVELLHEKAMAAVKVQTGSGREEGVITDGILTFAIANGDDEYELTFFLEVDRGSKPGRWKGKMRRLIAYGGGPYRRHCDTPYFTVLVITPLGEGHMRNLRRWTEDVLAAEHLRETTWAQSVLFTAVPAATMPPDVFWLGDGWYGPFAAQPVRVIDASLA